MAPPPRLYTKPAKTVVELLDHLQTRGLVINSVADAIASLETIGYYRLLPYCRALQDARKVFVPGTAFSDVVRLYDFDRRLRLLCLDAIERIEVALRASLNNRVAVALGPHFYMDPRNFETFTGFSNFASLAIAERKHACVKHYHGHYNVPQVPPIWSLTEAITFGKLSMLFADLRLPIRKMVAHDFGYDETRLVSWFRSINDLRNRCAHHNQVWNANFSINAPMQAKALPLSTADNPYFYSRSVVMAALLHHIFKHQMWRDDLKALLDDHPFVQKDLMGFRPGWEAMSFWA